MLDPVVKGGPRPHPDAPEEILRDYEEARSIVQLSPRGACALLRLAVQELVDDLLSGDDKLNDKIGRLVEEQNLPIQVQQSLDILRVVGNNAVHPGELDLRDDTQTATGHFNLLNFLVEDRIARPKQIEQLYGKLPPGALEQIEKRDEKA
jgi:hypothetical protein